MSHILNATTRSNGKQLVKPDIDPQGGEYRIVNAYLCVHFAKDIWDVSQSGFRVGDRVFCVPTRLRDALQARAQRESTTGIWAARVEPARSPPRSDRAECNAPNLDSPTKQHVPQGLHRPIDPDAPRPIAWSSTSTSQVRKRNRKKGTSHEVLGALPVSTHVVVSVTFQTAPGTPGKRKRRRS